MKPLDPTTICDIHYEQSLLEIERDIADWNPAIPIPTQWVRTLQRMVREYKQLRSQAEQGR